MPLTDLPDTFTYTEARKAGLSKHSLYRLRDSGQLEPIAGAFTGATACPLGRSRPLGGCATVPDGDPLPHLGPLTSRPHRSNPVTP